MDLSNENVIHIRKNGIEYLQFRKLLEYKDKINHCYTLGIDWNFRTSTSGKNPISKEEYNQNIDSYKKLCKELNMDYKKIVKPIQNHTDEVKIVESKIKETEPDFNNKEYDKTDGLITNKEGIILGTTNADCILLMFYDPVKNVIANTHSGWRGTIQRISVKTVEKMIKEFGSNPQDIICCICPSIRRCHFEVDKDVKDMFEKEFKDIIVNYKNPQKKNEEDEYEIKQKEQHKSIKNSTNVIIEEKIIEQKWNIDTVLINKMILKEAGLKEENIIDSGICSVCNSNKIHSYRVEKQGYGLNIAIIEKI